MAHLDFDDLDAGTDGAGDLRDQFGRPLRDLRISVTDRCNFRCRYCMPKEVFGPDFVFLPRDEVLSFEEITRVTRIFVEHGVQKIRLTGGEPTLRSDLPSLIRMLKELDVEVAMTTNATLLPRMAPALAEAGLDRITVSLDSIDDATFRSMNDMDFPVAMVLEGIEAAHEAGLGPIKVNAVARRGVNDRTLVDLAGHFRGTPHIVRFIEFMDVGTTNGWNMGEVMPASELAQLINETYPIEPLDPNYTGEVAQRYRYVDGQGEIGFITSVTQPFCSTCTRIRLAADGGLYTCLFASGGVDLKAPLRTGATDEELADIIQQTWSTRTDRYSELRTNDTAGLQRVEMSYIGG